MPWIDQVWYVARCTVDSPPGWLQRGTRASFGSRPLGSYDFNGWTIVSNALVDEVTIVGPGFRPVESCAEVLKFERSAAPAHSSSPARKTADAAATGGEVFYGGGPYSGGVIKRRDHKAEAEDAELRRRIEWAEHHHGRVDFELILTNLKIELGYESDLSRRGVRRFAA